MSNFLCNIFQLSSRLFCSVRTIQQKINVLDEWYNLDPNGSEAGCLLLGYEAFRATVSYKPSNCLRSQAHLISTSITKYLSKPGK